MSAAAWLAQFHENLRAGELVPLWAAHEASGLGSPSFGQLPLLPWYLSELAFAVTGDARQSFVFTAAIAALLAAIGMHAFLRGLLEALALAPRRTALVVASLAYAGTPALVAALRLSDAMSPSITHGTLALAAAALLALARKPSLRRVAVAALALAALAASAGLVCAMLASLLAFIGTIAFRAGGSNMRRFSALTAATLLGATASAFSWLPALAERAHVRVTFAASPGSGALLSELVRAGLPALFAVAWLTFRLAGSSSALSWKRGARATWLSARLLAVAAGSCLIALRFAPQAMHLAPILRPLFAFLVSALAGLAFCKEVSSPRALAAAALLVVVAVTVPASRPGELATRFVEALPAVLPASAASWPARSREQLLELAHGRAEGNCTQPAPTRIDCDIMAVRRSTLRFRFHDYPGWQALLDDKPAGDARTLDPLTGEPLIQIQPGKHVVRWKLRDTRPRATAKWLSALSLALILLALVQLRMSSSKGKRLRQSV